MRPSAWLGGLASWLPAQKQEVRKGDREARHIGLLGPFFPVLCSSFKFQKQFLTCDRGRQRRKWDVSRSSFTLELPPAISVTCHMGRAGINIRNLCQILNFRISTQRSHQSLQNRDISYQFNTRVSNQFPEVHISEFNFPTTAINLYGSASAPLLFGPVDFRNL